MNTKKNKNKHRQSKPSNPTPPQKKEVVSSGKEEDQKEEISESVKEERVPEILSDIVTQISDVKDLAEVETPSKPKRNRGKKKKEKDDDSFGIKPTQPSTTERQQVENEVIEDQKLPEKEISDINVVPTARKKKNKNKKHAEQFMEQQELIEGEKVIIEKDTKIVEKQQIEVTQEILLPKSSDITEQEAKLTKKKNKKKKHRNDSERSDKVEEISLCSTETHKNEDPSQIISQDKEKKEEFVEHETPIVDDSSTSECTVKEISIAFNKESTEKSEPNESIREKGKAFEVQYTEEVIETVKDEKNKKKKKDKKQSHKVETQVESTSAQIPLQSQAPDLKIETAIDENILADPVESSKTDVKDNIEESNLPETEFAEEDEKEKKSKYKGNIAKPIEKKNKPELQVTEQIIHPNDKPESITLIESVSIKQPGVSINAPQVKLDSSRAVKLQQDDTIDKPETKKTTEISKVELETEKSIPITAPEGGMGKKRRKSPKFFKQDRTKEVVESGDNVAVFEQNIIKTEEFTIETQQDMKECFQTTTMPSSASDIMQESTKSHESLELAPDFIEYPRSYSEQPLDDNNNMVIQEVIIEQGKLCIPADIPDTPFVQGSGETPIASPDLVATGIRVTEIEFNAPKEEKSDFKSKVLEVNQDMVELRLSIEKSLAELTAIEKSEDEKEKQFEEKIQDKTSLKQDTEILSEELTIDSIVIPETNSAIDKMKYEEKKIKLNVENFEELKDSSSIESKNTICEKPKGDKLLEPLSAVLVDIINQTKLIETEDSLFKTEEQSAIENPVTVDTPIYVPTKTIKTDETKLIDNPVNIDKLIETTDVQCIVEETKIGENLVISDVPAPPVCPARRDNKGKGKKKKDKQPKEYNVGTSADTVTTQTSAQTETATTHSSNEEKREEKSDQKSGTSQEKGKQQASDILLNESNDHIKHEQDVTQDDVEQTINDSKIELSTSQSPAFETIEKFEDALTSSVDDVNKSFEMIANESKEVTEQYENPAINVTAPIDDTDKDKRQGKVNPVSQPKNLLGHPDIPVPSNRTDYKKERNKTPNCRQAKVKIKDFTEVEIDVNKQSKESQTDLKQPIDKTVKESISSVTNADEEYIYKYSFRKVFLQSACHVCKKSLKETRVHCNFCNLIFYCSSKHKDEDWSQHQAFCIAISTIVHLKDQKHIYEDAKNILGHNYRLLRMEMIVSCEKVLKRKLVPWEQEALLYPRICADPNCREWRQNCLKDCDGCSQVSYCSDNSDHLPKTHQRWCKSYCLYQKLVCYQQTKGRLEPKLPTRIIPYLYQLPEKINEVLASMFEEKIDMSDLQYAALTQLATAPLTAVYSYQLWNSKVNSKTNGFNKKSIFTLHVVGAELQFEADALNKWEVFFLHLRPDIKELKVVLIAPDLNPSNLPLELLGKIKSCEHCLQNKRRVVFSFQDKMNYYDYYVSDDFTPPDLVCAFNSSIQRSSIYNGKDPWPAAISCILKLKSPLVITSHTSNELHRDISRIKQCSETSGLNYTVVSEPKYNTFASVRPDRNFISDDEMPLLFKNYCFSVVCGV